jgi:hypothetical protein
MSNKEIIGLLEQEKQYQRGKVIRDTEMEVIRVLNKIQDSIEKQPPPQVLQDAEEQNELWLEANNLYSKKDHSQDGRNLQMDNFVIIRKQQYAAQQKGDEKHNCANNVEHVSATLGYCKICNQQIDLLGR